MRQIALYLLLWGEASQIRFILECLSILMTLLRVVLEMVCKTSSILAFKLSILVDISSWVIGEGEGAGYAAAIHVRVTFYISASDGYLSYKGFHVLLFKGILIQAKLI